MKIGHCLPLVAGILALTLTGSDAATVINYANSAAVTARGDGPYTIGSIFLVNTAGLTITELGVMDADNPGDAGNNGFADNDGFANNATIDVGLWSWNGVSATLLASVAVPQTGTYIDGYRYADITDVSLTAGTQYILGARIGSGIEWFLDGGGSAAQFSASSPDFTLLLSTYNGTAGLNAPTTDGLATLGRWAPANAVVVPEPSVALLGGLGFLLLLRRRG